MIEDIRLLESCEPKFSTEDRKRRPVTDPVATTEDREMDDNEQTKRLEAAHILSALALGPVVLNHSGARDKPTRGESGENSAVDKGESGKKARKPRQRRNANATAGEGRATKRSRSTTARRDKLAVVSDPEPAPAPVLPPSPVLPRTPQQVPASLPSLGLPSFPVLPSLDQFVFSTQGTLLSFNSQPSLPSLPSNIKALGLPIYHLPSLNSESELPGIGPPLSDVSVASSSSAGDAGRSGSNTTNSSLNKSLPFKKRRIVKDEEEGDAGGAGEGAEASAAASVANLECRVPLPNGHVVIATTAQHTGRTAHLASLHTKASATISAAVSQTVGSGEVPVSVQSTSVSVAGNQTHSKHVSSRLLLPKPTPATGVPAQGLLVGQVVSPSPPPLTPPALPTLRFRLDQATNDRLVADIQTAVTPDEDGDLPLHLAVVHENSMMVKKFCTLMKMANRSVDKFNKDKQTPLNMAVKMGQEEAIGILLAYGADVNHQDQSGDTCLHVAVKKQNLPCLQLLTAESRLHPDFNTRNFDGITPLHSAVENKHVDMINFLLDQKADINMMDGKSGRTPLFYAAEANQLEVVDTLLRRGALPGVPNYAGITALMAAQARNLTPITKLLARVEDDREEEEEKVVPIKLVASSPGPRLPRGVIEDMDDQMDTASSPGSQSSSGARDAGKDSVAVTTISASSTPKERISSMLHARTQAAAAAAALASQNRQPPSSTATPPPASPSPLPPAQPQPDAGMQGSGQTVLGHKSSNGTNLKKETSPSLKSSAPRAQSRKSGKKVSPGKCSASSALWSQLGNAATFTALSARVASPLQVMGKGQQETVVSVTTAGSATALGRTAPGVEAVVLTKQGLIGPSESVRAALMQSLQENRSAGPSVMVVRRVSCSDPKSPMVDFSGSSSPCPVAVKVEQMSGLAVQDKIPPSPSGAAAPLFKTEPVASSSSDGKPPVSPSSSKKGDHLGKGGGGKNPGSRAAKKAAAAVSTTDGAEPKTGGKASRKRPAAAGADKELPPHKVQVVSSSRSPGSAGKPGTAAGLGKMEPRVSPPASAARDKVDVAADSSASSTSVSVVSSSLHPVTAVGSSAHLPPLPSVASSASSLQTVAANSSSGPAVAPPVCGSMAQSSDASPNLCVASRVVYSVSSSTISSAPLAPGRAAPSNPVSSSQERTVSPQQDRTRHTEMPPLPEATARKESSVSETLSSLHSSKEAREVPTSRPSEGPQGSSSSARPLPQSGHSAGTSGSGNVTEKPSTASKPAEIRRQSPSVNSMLVPTPSSTASSSMVSSGNVGHRRGGEPASETLVVSSAHPKPSLSSSTSISSSLSTSSSSGPFSISASPKLEAALRTPPRVASRLSEEVRPLNLSKSLAVPHSPSASPASGSASSSTNSSSQVTGHRTDANVSGTSSQTSVSSASPATNSGNPSSAASHGTGTSNGVGAESSSAETVSSSEDGRERTMRGSNNRNEDDVPGAVSSTTPSTPR